MKALVGLALLMALGTTNVAVAADADGVWQSLGYGRVIAIESEQVQTYDISKAGCVRSFKEPLNDFGKIIELTDNALVIKYGINHYHHVRLDALPVACGEKIADVNNPLLNFDTVWHTFQENYAFFETRKVDWPAAYQQYRSKLSDTSSPAELYAALKAMLDTLDDGHVKLDVPDTLRIESSERKTTAEQPSLFELQQSARAAITEKHLVDTHQINAGIVRWGWVKHPGEAKIAYIQLNAMLMLAQYPIESTGDLRRFYQHYFAYAENREYQYQDEVTGANMIMGQILPQLRDADAVILDLRFNGGGKDGAGLAVMNHFTDQAQTVFTKKARNSDGFSPPRAIQLQPADKTYTGPVYLLTAVGTSSAAEIMTLSSMPLKHVTRVGANTEGIFSDALDKMMPNGWEYTLSNEVYEDLQGNQYEHIGIPPNKRLDYPRQHRQFYQHVIDDVVDGDNAIEWVVRRHSPETQN